MLPVSKGLTILKTLFSTICVRTGIRHRNIFYCTLGIFYEFNDYLNSVIVYPWQLFSLQRPIVLCSNETSIISALVYEYNNLMLLLLIHTNLGSNMLCHETVSYQISRKHYDTSLLLYLHNLESDSAIFTIGIYPGQMTH